MSTLSTESHFLFALCQSGAEKALKAEVAKAHPELKFAFSRPGFVTFKSPKPVQPDVALDVVFARGWGASHGRIPQAPDRIERIVAFTQAQAGPLRLHVFVREIPESQGSKEPLPDPAPAFEAAIRKAAPKGLFHAETTASAGDLVLDVMLVENTVDSEAWIGLHRQAAPAPEKPSRLGTPGARFTPVMPPGAPSRAWIKLSEALAWSRAPVTKGHRAVEIGSAPGGASYALLQRDLHVLGIDPGEMDAGVMSHPQYRHLTMPVAQVRRDDIGGDFEWLLLDMNVKPEIALAAADRLAAFSPQTLLGVLLTIKLNEWELAARMSEYLARVKELGPGMKLVRATQLSTNRQEFLAYGLTARGIAEAKARQA